MPPSVHGTGKLGGPTASLSRITEAVLKLYDKLVDRELEVRRMSIAAIRLSPASEVPPQLSLFASQQDDERETALLKASIGLHKRFGKNSLVRGMDLFEAGTTENATARLEVTENKNFKIFCEILPFRKSKLYLKYSTLSVRCHQKL